jgi:U3 small nucleolar RNA-associated protein 14
LSTRQAQSDTDDDDDDDEEPSLKPAVEVPKKKSTEIPLILAPSQMESEANPWLTTTSSPVLPSSEYSKPTEVRNEDTSSSDSEQEEEEIKPSVNEAYGVTTTTKLPEQLNMPVTSKRVEIEPQQREEHQMNIQEAFADDDVLAEFEKEKTDINERDRPKTIDLSLPGWGEWAGSGVQVNKRKKRK